MAKGKGSAGTLLVLLLILVGVGAWNYHRNYERELAEQGPSPFEGYSDEALGTLADAYRTEIDGLQREYVGLKRRGQRVRDTQGLGEAVQEFERVQRGTRRLRDITTELATREARVRDIEEELRRRAHLERGIVLHLERLIGMPIPM